MKNEQDSKPPAIPPLPPATGSATYEDGWRDGITEAANIFDKWYRNNCITAGATNAIELAQRLFKAANIHHDKLPNGKVSHTAGRTTENV